MKYGLLALLILSVSCGDAPPGVAVTQRLRPRTLAIQGVDGATRTAVTSICSALLTKEGALPSAIGTTHLFESTQIDCEGNTISTGDIPVTIQSNGSAFVFKRPDGGDYFFPDVETTQRGIFTELCGNLFNLQNPLVVTNGTTGASEATYFAVSFACGGAQDGVCLEVTKATIQDNQATPHTSDLIRIRTNASLGKIGFFTYRDRVARSFCGNNENLRFTSILK